MDREMDRETNGRTDRIGWLKCTTTVAAVALKNNHLMTLLRLSQSEPLHVVLLQLLKSR